MAKKIVDDYIKGFDKKSSDDVFIDVTRSFGITPETKDIVIKKLKERGYNAMVDEAGVGSNKYGREGVDPLIIFDGDDVLEPVSTKRVSKTSEAKASKRNEDWYYTANRNRDKGEW